MPPTLLGVEACQGLADAAHDALLAVDDLGVVRLANARAVTLLGPGGELVGTPLETWLPGVRADAVAGSEPARVVGRRLDGASLALQLTARRVATPGGDLDCLVLRDLSGSVAVARARERLREELIASVSHELRTPLTSIMGYTEILVDLGEPVVSAEAQRILAIVRRNAERQLSVVEDLLTLSVLGGDGVSVDPVPTDLAEVLRAVLAEVGPLAAGAGVRLVLGGVPVLRVLGDPARLGEVVDSLVRQAVRLSLRGDEVLVRLLVEADHGLLEVCDQAGVPGSCGAGLTGLGGPVVRGIVEAHDGDLGVEHVPGSGTTVRVRLPLARD